MLVQRHMVRKTDAHNGPTFDPKQTLSAMANSAPNALRKQLVMTSAVHSGKTIEAQLEAMPTKYIDNMNDIYYDIVDLSRRNIQLERATDINGNPIKKTDMGIGKNGTKFYLYFPEDYFFEGETIVGEKNELYPVKVLKVEAANTLTKYLCEMWGKPNGMPGAELQLGKKFSVEYAAVARGLSKEVGGINRPSTARVKSYMSTIRIDHKVSGDLDDYAAIYNFVGVNEKGEEQEFQAVSSWEDWLVQEKFSHYKNHALYYGTTNMDDNGDTYNFDVSGRKIEFGSGLRELQEQSNKMYYNTFSLDYLEEASNNLCRGAKNVGEMNFTIRTGLGGAELLSKAILNKASGWLAISNNNPAVIASVQSNLHANALSFGAQFVQYKAPNGAVFTVEVDAQYDDTARNKIMMPGRNLTAESFRMDIYYWGSPENPNIQKLAYSKFAARGGEVHGYTSGFRNPLTGEMDNKNMSYTEDAATITKFTYLGIAMYDVDKSLSLIPYILS